METEQLYEVTCRIRRDVAAAWLAWIGPHVDEVLASPGMLGAVIARAEDEGDDEVYVCTYRVADRAALDRYVAERAPALRGDATERFGDALRTSRRILQVTDVRAP